MSVSKLTFLSRFLPCIVIQIQIQIIGRISFGNCFLANRLFRSGFKGNDLKPRNASKG